MAIPPGAEAAALLLFLAASAFFSLSETALIAVPRHKVRRLAEQGDTRASLLDRMLDEPERMLATILVGNNVVNIGATAFATVLAVRLFGPFGAAVAAVAMAILIVVVAEITPKTVAVQNSLPIALAVARPLRLVEAIFKPVVVLFSGLSRALVRPFGVRARGEAPFITQDEIEMLVRMGVEEGEVERFEQRVITELFDFTETDIHKVMTPAHQVHHIARSATLQQAVELANREGRTRIVVVDGDFDHVVGFLHIKDLLRLTDRELAERQAGGLVRHCLFATADTPADRLLVRMQRERCLLAVVQDAGNNIGIVTAEDLLEELVGEIHDEADADRMRRHEQQAAGAGGPPTVKAPPAG